MYSAAAFAFALISSVAAKTIDVQVGQTGLTYSPEATFADVGDQVIFHFHPKNHTVTMTSFDSVCMPAGNIDSGFMPVSDNATDNFPTFTVDVTTTQPMWFYCAQAAGTANGHCVNGMVFAINCPAEGEKSFDNFKKKALSLKPAASSSSSTDSGYGYPPSTSTDSGYGYPPSTSTSTSTSSAPTESLGAAGTVHTIVVGGPNGELTFSPSNISAQVGDVLSFEFHQKNHTVTQSSFAAPCNKLTDTNGQVIALDSGFMPVDAALTSGFPVYNVTVNATTPLWFYCRQRKPDNSSHCGAGMVFSANANETSDKSFDAFKGLAQKINGTNADTTDTNTTSGSTGASGQNGASAGIVINAAVSLGAAFFASALLL